MMLAALCDIATSCRHLSRWMNWVRFQALANVNEMDEKLFFKGSWGKSCENGKTKLYVAMYVQMDEFGVKSLR